MLRTGFVLLMMLDTEANFISNGRKLQFNTPTLLKLLCIGISRPFPQSYSLSHWHHLRGSAFWRQSCRTVAHHGGPVSPFLTRVSYPLNSDWCHKHQLDPCSLESPVNMRGMDLVTYCRSLIRGCCGSSLVSSQQAVNYPSITPF